MTEYFVRCNKVQKPVPYETTVWDSKSTSAKPAPDPITVMSITTIKFTPDYINSSPEAQGFTLAIDPSPPSPDIPKQPPTSTGASLFVEDNCKLTIDINLYLRATFQGQGYVVDAGKPTIRNRPLTAPPPRLRIIRLVLYAIIVLAAIYAIYNYFLK